MSACEGQAAGRRLRLLVWHVHGSWTSAFVRGRHDYLLPTVPDRGPWGRGLLGRKWPRAIEVSPDDLRETDVDAVVLQRPEELELTERWLDRRPGRDLPAAYVEHNAPRAEASTSRHPLADRDDIPLAHVTNFNDRMWDSGRPHGRSFPTASSTRGSTTPASSTEQRP